MTNKLLQARANAGAQVAIWFCFAFDWSREKREFFFLVTGRNKAKQLQSRINFDCQLNGAQFYGQAKLNSDIEFK